ncbi:MAG TPA: hypothetical protein VGV38_18730, partial [Pyrinomonadaceae bacterium]|nr:hypothetical protein [Pyrinomonadaceae bacterium]
MKQCPNCKEFYADKFGFCPVDGTQLGEGSLVFSSNAEADRPLSVVNPPDETETAVGADETIPSEPAGFDAPASAVHARGEYHLTMLEDEGLTRRLAKELSRVKHDSELTWPEFKRDPKGFTKRMAAGYGKLAGDVARQPYVPQSVMAAFIVMLFVVGFIAFAENQCRLFPEMSRCKERVRGADEEELELVQMLDTEIPAEQKEPDPGTAGMAKGKGGGSKPKQEKAGGGGGGGRQEALPASYGKLPPAVLAPQI